ncbi:MAG: hypothetical protein LLF83_09045 [Methanobacterium sp.]|nr:hypothetical protein [Methanobacterium sp.]
MMDDLELGEEWLEDTWKELEKGRGEILIETKKKRPKKTSNLQEIILVFEDTDNLDLEETYSLSIKANNIKIGKTEKNGKFKSIGLGKLKGNKFLEYLAWQDDILMETQLTMAFENGYSLEISGSVNINELK